MRFVRISSVSFVVMVVCILLFVYTALTSEPDPDGPGAMARWSVLVGVPAAIVFGVNLLVIARRWERGILNGTVAVAVRNAGESTTDTGLQSVMCDLVVELPGHAPVKGRYRAMVGPVDAARLMAGDGKFTCRTNPAHPHKVYVYLYGEHTGRHLTFQRWS